MSRPGGQLSQPDNFLGDILQVQRDCEAIKNLSSMSKEKQ